MGRSLQCWAGQWRGQWRLSPSPLLWTALSDHSTGPAYMYVCACMRKYECVVRVCMAHTLYTIRTQYSGGLSEGTNFHGQPASTF